MIRVTILSPVPAMRAGLRALISAEDGFEVDTAWEPEGAWNTGEPRVVIVTAEVLETISTDMVSLDIVSADTMSTAGNISPDVPVLLVQDESDRPPFKPLPAALTGRQSWGVISSEANGEALRAAVRALAQGLVVLSPDRAQDVLAQNNDVRGRPGPLAPVLSAADAEPVEPLTPREGDVLRLLAQGLTNRQIAAALGISEHTVKFHVSAIYAKLNVSNRAEAVRMGARWGFVAL